MKSPLRYPGGKSRAVKTILSYIPESVTELCSPFIGGGSVEIAAANRGMRVYGSDLFMPLADFWTALLFDPELLANTVLDYYPLEREEFKFFQRNFDGVRNPYKRAAIFYALNRASFSGSTFSGGMSKNHPRFTESSIERLRKFRCPNLSVVWMGYQGALNRHPNMFAYLDPPYWNGKKLYGDRGSTHIDFNHEKLSKELSGRNNWIMSYNDCSEIRRLYSNYEIVPLEWSYGMVNGRKSNEILILNS